MSAKAVWAPDEPMEGKTKSAVEHNGVYAFKTARDFLTELADHMQVYGKVALWGDVIEHELGYRAQFAKVISLEALQHQPLIDIKALRQRYHLEAA